MKEATFTKIINRIERAYLIAQVVFSWCIIVFGVTYAIRCAIERTDAIFVILFGCIAYVGYNLMLRASLQELREARKADKDHE